MSSISVKNFQVGIVDDPTVEDQGGFEFASGMDIFSEPGVMKASYAMTEASYFPGASPTAMPITGFLNNTDFFVAMGGKILVASGTPTFDVFITNSQGTIRGMGLWNGYLFYASALYLGRVGRTVPVSGQNDTFIDFTANQFVNTNVPMVTQGGSLKIGSGRYIHSIDEAFNPSFQALKLQSDLNILTLVNHFNNLYAGTSALGAGIVSSVYAWDGTILSTGSALPNAAYEMTQRGMNALFSDSRTLYGFPDSKADILGFDGAGFSPFRKIYTISNRGQLAVNPSAVEQYDNTVLFAGSSNIAPGIYQMSKGAICQGFVPAGYTPGVDASINISFIKRGLSLGTTGQTILYIGYYRASDNSYHIEVTTMNRQNNAILRTLWHKAGTDRLKRWQGIKLNLRPLPSGCSVAVSYRMNKEDAFTDSGYTITSANQDKPVIFSVQPRSVQIQYKLTYTTSTTYTPELLSYDPIFEVLKTNRK